MVLTSITVQILIVTDFTQFGKPNRRDLMNYVGHKVTAKCLLYAYNYNCYV